MSRSEWFKKNRQSRIERGICTQCPNQAQSGKTRCPSCLEKSRRCHNTRRASHLARDLCWCGNTRDDPKFKSCEKCRDKFKLINRPDHNSKRKTQRDKVRLEVFNHYGNKCSCPLCKETNIELLTIDHVNNNGAEHRRIMGGSGYKIHLWLKRNNYPGGFRLLCWSCNSGRHLNNGICPHIVNALSFLPDHLG